MTHSHFVTLYYGQDKQPERQILKLSDLYKCKEEHPELELIMTQYNVNPRYNEEMKRRCPELDGYIKYVDNTRKYHKKGMSYEDAVKKAVDECIEENILKEFFIENKAEVVSMTIFEYDEEEHMRLERKEQFEKGEEVGENKKLLEQINKKLKKGKTIPQIADELEENEESIERLIEQMRADIN